MPRIFPLFPQPAGLLLAAGLIFAAILPLAGGPVQAQQEPACGHL